MLPKKNHNEINPEFPVLITDQPRFYLNILLFLQFHASNGRINDFSLHKDAVRRNPPLGLHACVLIFGAKIINF